MSQHSSLKAGKAEGVFRSVLKRFEKIKELTEKEKWDEEKDSIYGLPKVRRIKFKVKKEKAPEEEQLEEGAVEGAAAPAEGAAAAEKAPAEKAPGAGEAKGAAKKNAKK